MEALPLQQPGGHIDVISTQTMLRKRVMCEGDRGRMRSGHKVFVTTPGRRNGQRAWNMYTEWKNNGLANQ